MYKYLVVIDYDQKRIDLYYLQYSANSMKIFVNTISGKTITILVEPSDSISHLMYKIQEIEGIPVIHQLLMYAGNHLEVGRSLTDYNIQDEDIIYLARQEATFQVIIKMEYNRTITYDVEPDTTGAQLSLRLSKDTGIREEELRMIYGKRQVKDNDTVASLNIQNVDVIRMLFHPIYN
jgi:ubiquitin C